MEARCPLYTVGCPLSPRGADGAGRYPAPPSPEFDAWVARTVIDALSGQSREPAYPVGPNMEPADYE